MVKFRCSTDKSGSTSLYALNLRNVSCRSIEEQTIIAIVCATHNDGINKGLNGLACKILSNTSYVVQMERGGFTQLISMSDHGHVFIEPGARFVPAKLFCVCLVCIQG